MTKTVSQFSKEFDNDGVSIFDGGSSNALIIGQVYFLAKTVL